MPDLNKIFTTESIKRNKYSALRIFVKINFSQKQEIPIVFPFTATLTFFPPEQDRPNKKKELWRKTLSYWVVQILQNQDVSLLPFKLKIGFFFTFLSVFWSKSGRGQKLIDQHKNLIWHVIEQ